jgi:hypothetical protein
MGKYKDPSSSNSRPPEYKGLSAHEYRKSVGLCQGCGKVPPEPEKTRCVDCLQKARWYYEQKPKESAVYKRRRAGLCVRCGVAETGGKARCEECSKHHAQYGLSKIRQGLCSGCKNRKPREGKSQCESCAKKTAIRDSSKRQRAKAQGFCIYCQERSATSGKATCERCNTQHRIYRSQRRQKIIDGYGGKCACCGESNSKFLTVDHVNNDGAKERKSVGRNNETIFRKIIRLNFPPEYQLLCFNCNCARFIHGVCPHKQA